MLSLLDYSNYAYSQIVKFVFNGTDSNFVWVDKPTKQKTGLLLNF